ncbi:MAG: hypothetical protein AAB390_03710, partial [Patescibacteria group bacterium]
MKKILFIVFGLVYATALTFPVQAINLGSDVAKEAATKAGYAADTNQNTLAQIIGRIVKAVLTLTGVMFTALIVWAGNMWMGARGEQEPIEKAKKMIQAAAFGLIITLAAYTISNFAVNAILERA